MNKEKFKTSIVPWKNPAEFIQVYKYAYSDDLAKNRWAVEQMAVWETRCWPSLPTAVEATLLFVRSKIQDQLYEANKSLCHAQEVEMMYANSVVRFVNLLVENDQNAKTKKRISYLAAERNIPPWIVDIRHNSTHGFNPTLPVLRMAHETIMAYLEETFWLPESSRIQRITKTVDETSMIELWQDYKAKQYLVVIQEEHNKERFIPPVDNVLKKMSSRLSKLETRRAFLNVIVRDFATDDILPLIEDDELMKDPNMMSCVTLPYILQTFYNPVIYLLHKHDLIASFIELLLLSQDKRHVRILQTVVDLAVMYILDLIKGVTGSDPDSEKPFVQKGVNLNKYRLLYSCAQGCSSSARIVFERLVTEMKLMAWAQDLSAMMNIKQGKYIQRFGPRRTENERKKQKFDITFTAEDLEEDIHEAMDKKILKLKKNPWSLAPVSINWASIPIGHVFHPIEIAVQEEPKQENESSPMEICENMYTYACDESKPVEKTRPDRFIFSESPNFTSMIYQGK